MSKFLTYEDRLVIAQLLQENVSFGVIGNELGKDRTTIAKEIKKHSYDKKSGRPGYPYAILGNNPSTDDADAMEYFNKVRKRAGLEPQNSITYEDIRRERRLELCLEGQYWYDLVRRAYYKQQEVLNYITGQDRGTAIPVVWDADTQTLKRDEDSDETKRAIGDVDSSIFLLPYPESETVQNPLLKADPMPYAFKEDRITDLFN